MEISEALDFVRQHHFGVLATQRRDGRPQLSNIAYSVFDGDVIAISMTDGRAKTRNAERDQRVSVVVLSDDWDGAWVQVDGDAEVLHMPEAEDALVDYYRCIAGEHPDWDEYRAAMRVQGKSLIRVTPTRWGPVATGGFPADVAARIDG